MADISFDIDGLEQLQAGLENLERKIDDPNTWFVGSNVEYSVYLEFGTSKMDPRPFFRPTLSELRAGVETFIRANTRVEPETIDDVDEFVRVLAFAFEKRVKEIITEKLIVDTGTLRASILAVPDPSVLPDADDFNVPENGTLDPEAGRRFVQDIEIEV